MSRSRASVRSANFWKRLAQTYGARLQEQYGPTCPSDWCEVIDRTDEERLVKALVVIRREHLQFPPTLGQFEAAIPKRQFGKDHDSIPERLARYAVATLRLCEHELWPPWTYFGRQFDDGTPLGGIETSGVVIPGCKSEDCPHYGRANHRVLVRDLPA